MQKQINIYSQMNTVEKKAALFGGEVHLNVKFDLDYPVYNGNIPVEFCAVITNSQDFLESIFAKPAKPTLAFTETAKYIFKKILGLDLISYDLGLFESDPDKGFHLHGIAYLKGEGLKDKVDEIRLNLNAQAVADLCAEAGITLSA